MFGNPVNGERVAGKTLPEWQLPPPLRRHTILSTAAREKSSVRANRTPVPVNSTARSERLVPTPADRLCQTTF